MSEHLPLVALTLMPKLGAARIKKLLSYCGSPQEVLHLKADDILRLFGRPTAEQWSAAKALEDAEKEVRCAEKLDVQLLAYTDKDYPSCFHQLRDAPPLLYVRGNPQPLEKSVALVGTREATIYGLSMAEQLGRDFAEQEYAVVSGLARGIDTAAHEGALQRGRTVAILGSGLAQLYPPENGQLAQKITERGALISEFALNCPPDKYNFPRRNRLVSCLSQAVVLIEAPLKSGAMLTMDLGKGQGRPLFALPGRVDSNNFRGNHQLIKTGVAHLIEDAADVIEALGEKVQVSKAAPLRSPEEEKLLAAMPAEETTLERLQQLTGLPVHAVNVLLMRLLLKRMIKEYPGKLYKKV